MEKNIKIDSKTTLKVSNNIGWMLAYRDQFGRDIVPALVPVLTGIMDIAIEVSKVAGQEGVTGRDILAALDSDILRDAVIQASGLEMVDLINIVWAMAKAADDDIDEPREWVKQFDHFPLDTIVPTILDLAAQCMVSTKNYKRLREAMQALSQSPSTDS